MICNVYYIYILGKNKPKETFANLPNYGCIYMKVYIAYTQVMGNPKTTQTMSIFDNKKLII